MKTRIMGLLAKPPTIVGYKPDGSAVLMQTTRIGLQLNPEG